MSANICRYFSAWTVSEKSFVTRRYPACPNAVFMSLSCRSAEVLSAIILVSSGFEIERRHRNDGYRVVGCPNVVPGYPSSKYQPFFNPPLPRVRNHWFGIGILLTNHHYLRMRYFLSYRLKHIEYCKRAFCRRKTASEKNSRIPDTVQLLEHRRSRRLLPITGLYAVMHDIDVIDAVFHQPALESPGHSDDATDITIEKVPDERCTERVISQSMDSHLAQVRFHVRVLLGKIHRDFIGR